MRVITALKDQLIRHHVGMGSSVPRVVNAPTLVKKTYLLKVMVSRHVAVLMVIMKWLKLTERLSTQHVIDVHLVLSIMEILDQIFVNLAAQESYAIAQQ